MNLTSKISKLKNFLKRAYDLLLEKARKIVLLCLKLITISAEIFLAFSCNLVKKTTSAWLSLFSRVESSISQNRTFYGILLLTIITAVLIISGYLVGSRLPFEGEVLVKQISLEASEDQVFLQNLLTQKIGIEGKSIYTLGLGAFSSEQVPELTNFSKITLITKTRGSRIEIRTLSPKNMQIASMRIKSGAKVIDLRYQPNQTLYFELKQIVDSRNIQIDFGGPVSINCVGECYIQEADESFQDINFVFQTNISEFFITSPSEADFDISLKDVDNQEIFWGYNSTNKVAFTKVKDNYLSSNRRNNLNNSSYSQSSILAGIVRLSGKNLRLESGQFLLIGDQDIDEQVSEGAEDIQQIRYIEIIDRKTSTNINDKSSQVFESNSLVGLKIGFSGETESLSVGLSPKLPVESISTSFFSRFSPELTSFLLLIFASFFGGTLTWLFGNFPTIHRQG